MTDQLQSRLQAAIRDTVARIHRFKERKLGEENTKASMIEPMLETLGWAIRDPDEVHREFKSDPKDAPVDYALRLLRKPMLLVEAKGLGENLSDRRWIGQILGYAAVAGVEWCVLTDGDEYRYYNTTVAVDAEEKLFYQFRLSETKEEDAAKLLALISRSNMEENRLAVLWNAHFVDRRVKDSLLRILESRDKGLVRLIRRKGVKLAPKEIIQSLQRLEIRIESPTARIEGANRTPADPPIGSRKKRRLAAGRKASDARRLWGSITLRDLIMAGLLASPLKLFRKYKGQQLDATLQSDGRLEFRGTDYESCSTAAEYARATVVGRRMNTNGWDFWQYLDSQGKKRTLNQARKEYVGNQVKKPDDSK